MPRRFVTAVFDTPVLYAGLRALFLGGLPTRPVLKLLQATKDDVVLDIGCGTGFIANMIPFRHYYGFDMDAEAIRRAKLRNIPNTTFVVSMVQDYDFGSVLPTKAILYGVLHHLSDADAIELLKRLAASRVQSVVTLDPVYAQFNMINNILCRYDRGRYVRTRADINTLISRTPFAVADEKLHHANTLIAKYILFHLEQSAAPVLAQRASRD